MKTVPFRSKYFISGAIENLREAHILGGLLGPDEQRTPNVSWLCKCGTERVLPAVQIGEAGGMDVLQAADEQQAILQEINDVHMPKEPSW
jgi:hypothetical protein